MVFNQYTNPISICWDITTKCNERCKFCYRVDSGTELIIEDNIKILQKLIDGGVNKISLVGGEPLLYDGIIDILTMANRAGLMTSLTTNGILLDKNKMENFNGILDWLSLPLDCCDNRIQSLMTRRKGHFENIIRLFEFIKANNYIFNIKVNTVATKINKESIPNMVDIIKKYNIGRWKIFQYFPIRGEAKINQNIFNISNSEYDILKNEINDKSYLIPDCMISFSGINELQESYLSISPDGSARVSIENRDVILGNLLKNDLNELWKTKFIDKNKHLERNKWLLKKLSLANYCLSNQAEMPSQRTAPYL